MWCMGSDSATCSWIGMFRRTTELSEKLLHYPDNRCEFIDLSGVIIQGVYEWAKCFRSGRGKWIKKWETCHELQCVWILPVSCSAWRMAFVCFSLFAYPLLIYVMFLYFSWFYSKSSHLPKHILSLVDRNLGSWLRIYTGARVFFLC